MFHGNGSQEKDLSVINKQTLNIETEKEDTKIERTIR